MTTMRNAFAGILAGLLILLSPGGADAAPADGRRPAARSVCETGFRGQSAYDRKCLKNGTVRDGVALWLHTDRRERRAVCKMAKRTGLRTAVRESFYDVAYDSFRNHGSVLKVTRAVAFVDCRLMGYRVK